MALTDKQLNAIPLLLAGKRYADIATELGVARETIWSWRCDPEFLAETNRQRAEIQAETKQEIVGLLRRALEVLQTDMGPREALEIVKLYAGQAKELFDVKPGETDPGKIVAGQEREAREREGKAREQERKELEMAVHRIANDAYLLHQEPDDKAIAKQLKCSAAEVSRALSAWLPPLRLR